MYCNNFKKASELWVAGKRGFVKESSLAAYSLTIRKHILPRFKRLDEITPGSVQGLIDSKVEDGLSLNSIKAIVLVMKMLITFFEDEGWIESKVYRLRLPQRKRWTDPQVIPLTEEKTLIHWLRTHPTPYNVGILICVYCGLRIGEVCALKWEDIDMQDRVIHVKRTVYRVYVADRAPQKSVLAIGTPKTADSWRDVPVADKLAKSISEILLDIAPGKYLMTGRSYPADPQNFRNNFKRILKELGIQPRKVHSLRHTFATRCIESKCDFKTLSSILGHSDVTTTLNIYVHPDMSQKRRCVEKMVRGI